MLLQREESTGGQIDCLDTERRVQRGMSDCLDKEKRVQIVIWYYFKTGKRDLMDTSECCGEIHRTTKDLLVV